MCLTFYIFSTNQTCNTDTGELKNEQTTYNDFHNILRLFDVLPNFPFTTSETLGGYYL